MRKTITILVSLICGTLFSINTFAQTPNYVWANRAGNDDSDNGISVAVDGNGNSYVVGTFSSDSITFGSITLTNLTSTSGLSNVYIVKYDSNGNVIWAKKSVAYHFNFGVGIDVDANGNCYITGTFQDNTISFGSLSLVNANLSGTTFDMFILKYDSNGNEVWARKAGGPQNERGNDIKVDANGNSYVTGTFSSSSITFGTTILTNSSANTTDMYTVKYDTNGNVIWAYSVGGTSDDFSESIALDSSGNSYVTGYFQSSSITFGTNTFTNAGNRDLFIVKYDANGIVVWAKKAGGSSADGGMSIDIDGSGNCYVTGYFSNASITFGSTTLTNAGVSDMFIVKYDASGTVVWAKKAGVGYNEEGRSIVVDAIGNSYVSGNFAGPNITFGSTILTNTTIIKKDIFIVKYDTNGNEVWAMSAGGTSDDIPESIILDGIGNIYLTGSFTSSSVVFGSNTLINTATPYEDMFTIKLNEFTVGMEELQNEGDITIFPNPFSEQTTISFSTEQKNTTIKIIDLLGKEIKTINFSGRQLVLDKAIMKAGVYFVWTTDERKRIFNRKIIIQ